MVDIIHRIGIKAPAASVVRRYIPLSRRAEAFRMNDRGWASQSEKLARYVEAR